MEEDFNLFDKLCSYENLELGYRKARKRKTFKYYVIEFEKNLTSQFFANIYLDELDQFVKHELKARYYIRYVDDFVILHHSRKE